MYFKKLELVGFKSFLEKTNLNFEPGITTVVGPNGCGKSNIFDSIRWALGEQSVKSLRGSEMQDVIFNGTDKKEPVGMAEVTLIFDNGNKIFAIDDDEVAITRRIFRSGESEYLLNKTQVRLKDILEILSGTGIGAEGYSLIEQGKIDLILSSRPEDRRLVFDEASGITKYKAQKKEAMRKLEETEQNLLRVNDIIAEIKRQIGSLERQANKARKYKEVFEELKLKEVSLGVLQKKQLSREQDEIASSLSQLQEKEVRLLEIIKEQEEKISSRQAALKAIEDNLMSVKNEILNLENSILRNREQIRFNQERTQELEKTKTYLQAQIEQVKKRILTDEEKLNKVRQEYGSIKKDIEEKALLLHENEFQLNILSAAIKNSQNNIIRSKKEILDLITQCTKVKNEAADLVAKQQILSARKKRLDIEKAKTREEKVSAEDNLRNIKQELENLEKNYQDLNSKIFHSRMESEQEELSLNQINKDLEDSEKQRLVLASQRRFLEELKTKYEDISESINAVIYLDKAPRGKISGLVIKIKDYLNLREEDKGNLAVVNLKLSGEAKPFDLDTQRISTDIHQLEERITSLMTSQTTKEMRIAQLQQFIQDTEKLLRQEELVIANKKAVHQNILEQFNKIKEEEEIILLELSEAEKELVILDEKIKQSQKQSQELGSAEKKIEDLLTQEQENIALNSQSKENTLVLMAQIKTEREALTKRIGSDEATLKILEDTYQQDKENLQHSEMQIQEANAKQGTFSSKAYELENKINELEIELENKKGLLKEAENKYQAFSQGEGDVVAKIEKDRKELAGLKEKVYQLQMQNKDVDFKITSIKERILQCYKVDLPTVRETTDQETTPQDSKGDAAPDSLTGQQAPKESAFEILTDIDEHVLGDNIHRLKEKLDSYGTVNLVAIEEYDELKKRYDFLNQQQSDLISAKESLHEAILKINRTTRKLFLETFEKIRVEFRNYFKLLFNGGDAQVFLIDENEPLESGIEIICRPPGKKLQNVLLLSGGEKALSAIALLFAIFKIKPAPFCVLDEIDAALDESNIDRFSRLLQEFCERSQFIVITHNKRTIANADVMYGITMEESGVSKIISVKFKEKVRPKVNKEPVAELV